MKNEWKRSRSIISLICLVTLLLGLLSGCSESTKSTASSSSTGDETHVIVDMLGRNVTLKKDIKRAVTVEGCCPVPGIISMLGASDKLVSGLCYDYDLQMKVAPEYKAIAGSMVAQADKKVNYEELLAQNADVIFLYNIDNYEELASLGLPVVCVKYSSWDDLKSMVKLLGGIFDKEDKATEYLKYSDNLLQDIHSKLAVIPEDKKVTAMMSTSVKPLTIKGLDSHNQSMFEFSGAIPIASKLNLSGYSVEVSMEDLIKANADYYILSGFLEKDYQEMQTNADWQKLSSIANGHLYITPIGLFPWDRPGAELPLLALWQAQIFYPDIITEDYMHEKIVDFYKTLFNYTLTDEDYSSLLKYAHN